MKIAVLGSGAMGSVYGARLLASGADVTLLDVNEDHIAAVRENGLQVALDDQTLHLNIPIQRPEEFTGPVDLILLFTKTFHTEAALKSVQPLLKTTPVMSLQNGIGNVERLAQLTSMDRIIIGTTMTPADMIAPGKVASHGAATTQFYAADGQHRPILDEIARTLCAAGIEASLDANIQAAIWHKAAFNCAVNGLCALSDGTPGSVGHSAYGRALAVQVAQEVVNVAHASGVAADFDVVRGTMQHAFDNHHFHEPSMLQDRKAGRRTEIDALNGAVAAMGARLNVSVNANMLIMQLVHLFEDTHTWRNARATTHSRQPEQDANIS